MELPITQEQLDAFCLKWKIAELRVFGSAARGELGPESDIDFLYRFEPHQSMGWEIVNAIEELKELTGRDVDFVSFDAILHSRNQYSKSSILRDARLIYPHAA